MLPACDGLFCSFFFGGFKYATHRHRNGRRIDVLATIQSNLRAANRQLTQFSIRTERAGFRWHRIKRQARWFDFLSVRPLVRVADEADSQVIADLLHID